MKRLSFLISIAIAVVFASCRKDNPDGWQSGAEPDGYFSCDGVNYGYKVYGTKTWMTDNVAYLPYVVPSSTVSDTIPYYYVYGYEGTNPISSQGQMRSTTDWIFGNGSNSSGFTGAMLKNTREGQSAA